MIDFLRLISSRFQQRTIRYVSMGVGSLWSCDWHVKKSFVIHGMGGNLIPTFRNSKVSQLFRKLPLHVSRSDVLRGPFFLHWESDFKRRQLYVYRTISCVVPRGVEGCYAKRSRVRDGNSLSIGIDLTVRGVCTSRVTQGHRVMSSCWQGVICGCVSVINIGWHDVVQNRDTPNHPNDRLFSSDTPCVRNTHLAVQIQGLHDRLRNQIDGSGLSMNTHTSYHLFGSLLLTESQKTSIP